MILSGSRVPHLARAIAEKKQLRQGCNFNSFAHRLEVSCRPLLTARSVSSSSQLQRTPPTNPLPLQEPRSSSSLRTRYEAYKEEKVEDRDPSKDPTRIRRYLMGVSFFGIIIGAYIFYTYTTYTISLREYNASPNKLEQNADVSNRWCDEKRNFDYEVNSQESVMFMKAKRRRLIREAYGDVLEVSCGTGRNMELYDTRPYSATEDSSYGRDTRHMITSLTFNDQSPVMVETAQKKWSVAQKSKRYGDRFRGDVKFVQGDAGIQGVIPRPAGGYDTIVQSMGVCSMAEPVKFLRHLGELVRQPGEAVVNASSQKFRQQEAEDGNGGRIFLLEHGRGYDRWNWLNQYLDSSAPMHADRYGCWYNKDIEKVIKDSGLVVERIKRYYFGTVWEVVLRPASRPLPKENILVSTLPAEESSTKQKSWWSSLWN